MSELSEIQNGIFHLSIKSLDMSSETFANDKYIDEDQAKLIAASSLPKPYTPADDNYPFSLVDNYLLDSDLEIDYNYNAIACSAYPGKAYLSRNNYSYADFSNLPPQPDAFLSVIKGTEPYTGEKVTATYMKVTDYEVTVPEMKTKAPQSSWAVTQWEDCTKKKAFSPGTNTCLPKSDLVPTEACTPAEPCYSYVYNTYVRVDSAQLWVWLNPGDNDLLKRCAPVTKPNSCLPPSAIRRVAPLQPKVNTCLPPSAIRPRTIPVTTCANNGLELSWKNLLPYRSQGGEAPKTNSFSVSPCRT